VCESCDFKCCKESDYIRHTLTRKHKAGTEFGQMNHKHTNMCSICNKSYNSRSSFYRHKKKCKKEEKEEDIESQMNIILMEILKQKQNQTMIDKNTSENNNSSLIIELIKQHQDFKNLMTEQNKYILELIKNTSDI